MQLRRRVGEPNAKRCQRGLDRPHDKLEVAEGGNTLAYPGPTAEVWHRHGSLSDHIGVHLRLRYRN